MESHSEEEVRYSGMPSDDEVRCRSEFVANARRLFSASSQDFTVMIRAENQPGAFARALSFTGLTKLLPPEFETIRVNGPRRLERLLSAVRVWSRAPAVTDG